MRQYKASMPFDVPMKLLIPTESKKKGTAQKEFPSAANGILFFGSFRTYGGTEVNTNDVYAIRDTAVVDTWYRPDITSECRVYVCETGETYDIISRPENIGMRHQYMQFKMERTGGKA